MPKHTDRASLLHVVTKGDFAYASTVRDKIADKTINDALRAGVIAKGKKDGRPIFRMVRSKRKKTHRKPRSRRL